MQQQPSPLDRFLAVAQQFATPFARSFAYGRERASQMELDAERLRYHSINGSGPDDPRGFKQLPKSNQAEVAHNPFPIHVTQNGLIVAAISALALALLFLRSK